MNKYTTAPRALLLSYVEVDSTPTLSPPAPADRKALAFIFITVFLDLLGTGILIPITPFIVRQFNTDALTVGMLALTFSAAQFAASPFLGVLSDRYGRRRVLLASVFGTGVGYFLFGYATSLWVLFASRLLDGLSGGNIATAQAYIADVSPPQDRAKNFGLIGAAFGLGLTFGPALGGFLARWGLTAPAYGAAVLSMVAVAFGYFVLPESLPAGQRRREPLRLGDTNPFRQVTGIFARRELRGVLLAVAALNLAFSGLQSNFGVFSLERFRMGPQENAMLFTYLGVVSVFMQGFVMRRLTIRGREGLLAPLGLVLMIAGFGLIAASWREGVLYVCVTLIAVGSSFANPTLMSILSHRVSPREQGLVLGSTQGVNSLMRTIGPGGAGAVYDWFGQGAPYWSGALWLAVSLGLVLKEELAPPRASGATG